MTSAGPQLVSGSITSTQDPVVVWITQAEYDSLVRTAHRYSNLCRNLIGGGVTQAVIEVLSNDASFTGQSPESEELSVRHPTHTTPVELPTSYGEVSHDGGVGSLPRYSFHSKRQSSGQLTGTSQSWDDWGDSPSEDVSLSIEIPSHSTEAEDAGNPLAGSIATGNGHTGQPRPQFEREAIRSVQLLGLPEDTSHAEIAAIIRGGALLDIYIRKRDNVASVSFVHAADALAFYDYARKHDVYIKNKRVAIKWSDRQYILAGHLAQKLGSGATRNLVIRRCDPSHTEASIRQDLEHIHNLVVVKLMFLDGDCYISTNSVANAMFARTCMMSRFKYKGSRIEWDIDECAQALDQLPTHRRRKPVSAPIRQPVVNSTTNRFELLNLDG